MNKFLIIAALCAIANAQFQCPSKNGLYDDPIQCDKYWECNEGRAKEKICPDGLVFDQTIKRLNKCDQPFNVDCGDREELQPPMQINKQCPRKNGYFAHPDPSECGIFYNCNNGEYIEQKCTAGLHFDEYSGTCVWPDTAKREGCAPEKKQLADGFTCPKEKVNDASGQVIAHPHFAHPSDCQKFYVCLSGTDPRELSCASGEVYNEETTRCDNPENVAGCEDWYNEDPKKP